MQFKKIFFATCMLFTLSTTAVTGHAAPSAVADQDFPKQADPHLQTLLDSVVDKRGISQLVKQKKISITLVDISQVKQPKMANINGDTTLYAASLPKLAIMLAVFEEISQGNLEMTPSLRTSLDAMIKHSSNVEASRLYHLVGPARIAEILQSERYQLYDQDAGGGLWVGKEYGKEGAWKRDPLEHVSHGASGLQVARFYYMLERSELASPENCPVMKDILADSAINHKFVKGMNTIHPDAQVFRKSGTWRDYHADSAIIERKDGRQYIAVVLAQTTQGGKLLEQIIVDLDNIIDQTPVAAG
jgi:beta-lactamase class A